MLPLKAVVAVAVSAVVATVVVVVDAVATVVAVEVVVALAVPARTSGFLRPSSVVSSSTDTSLLLRKSTLTQSPSRRHPSLTSSSRSQRRTFLTKS
jgi:hypothetical protein